MSRAMSSSPSNSMMLLPPGWYAFASPEELSRNKPNALRRFGLAWVVWRSSTGTWVAQSDRCPHRGAKLSQGVIKHNTLQCPFHGFCFQPSGACAWVPELQKEAPLLQLATQVLREEFDFLWINWGNTPERALPWFRELENAGFSYSQICQRWSKHFSRCVENQLDYAHLPFVHATTIGRGFDVHRKVHWQLNEKALTVSLGDSTSQFQYRFPNVWKLVISPKMAQTLMFVPVDHQETWIYSRAYQRFTSVPLLKQLIAWIAAHIANPFILAQDHQVVMGQQPEESLQAAANDHLFPSDQAILAFRAWLKTAQPTPAKPS